MKALNEVYRYYKSKKAGVPLFKIQGGYYIMALQDTEQIADLSCYNTNKVNEILVYKFPSTEIFDILSMLAENGIKAYLISYRNDNGEFDLPDVEKLEYEKEIDY